MIRIAQMISTIQCEGPYLGTPTFLVRFEGCNLNCPFCDTKWAKETDKSYSPGIVDKFYPKKFTDNRDNLKTLAGYILNNMPPSNHIMFTGGEPLIYHDAIIDICNNIFDETKELTVEIETNGVLLNEQKLEKFKNKLYHHINLQFNISPKLDSECYPDKKTTSDIIYMIKMLIVDTTKYNRDNMFFDFKFIYTKRYEEIIKTIKQFNYFDLVKDEYGRVEKFPKNFPTNDFYLMPLTDFDRTKNYDFEEEFEKYRLSCLETIEFCKNNKGFIFTPREHLFLFTDKDESK